MIRDTFDGRRTPIGGSGEGTPGPEILSYKREIEKADGTLYRLQRTDMAGNPLYIAARYLNPSIEGREGINKAYLDWDKGPKAVLIVDTYTGQDERRIEPIGHIDWTIRNTRASGMANVHGAPISKNEYERNADEKWGYSATKAFEVDEQYHRQNIGTLMLATSGVILPKIGVREFFAGHLLPPADSTYKRFGMSQDDFLSDGRGAKYLPIGRLSESKMINKAIAEFV